MELVRSADSPHGSHWSHEIHMGMGFAKLVSWEWERLEGMKTLHFSISNPRIADHQTLLMDPCFAY